MPLTPKPTGGRGCVWLRVISLPVTGGGTIETTRVSVQTDLCPIRCADPSGRRGEHTRTSTPDCRSPGKEGSYQVPSAGWRPGQGWGYPSGRPSRRRGKDRRPDPGNEHQRTHRQEGAGGRGCRHFHRDLSGHRDRSCQVPPDHDGFFRGRCGDRGGGPRHTGTDRQDRH